MTELYDDIGRTYANTRRPDSRIAARIHRALGDARTVVNVGAGAGSYEPTDREVTAVEPSETMIAQRPPGSAPVVRAYAEELPFADGQFDLSMALLTDHHWKDRVGGLRELRRVAQRTVVFTWDPEYERSSWLVRDYMPDEFATLTINAMPLAEIASHLGGAAVEVVPIPHDCSDGFLHAYWRRPETYLDPAARANISIFAQIDASAGLARLEEDLRSGAWHERNAAVLELDELDLGYRLLIAPGA